MILIDILILIAIIAVYRATHNILACAGIYAGVILLEEFIARSNFLFALAAAAAAFVVSYVVIWAVKEIFKW